MDRNLAGETSFRFSPTLTETASTELLNIQKSIDQLNMDLHQQNDHIAKLEGRTASEVDALHQKIYANNQAIAKVILSMRQDIQVIGEIIFQLLTLFPIRILNWFKCFAELTICETTSKQEGKDIHPVLIVLHPLNMSPNIDKKTIRALNKLSYKSLARIKKAEKKPTFKIILSSF